MMPTCIDTSYHMRPRLTMQVDHNASCKLKLQGLVTAQDTISCHMRFHRTFMYVDTSCHIRLHLTLLGP